MLESTGLLELAWEDGQIVMKGHSPPPPPAKRPRTSPFFELNPGLDKPPNSNMNQADSLVSEDKASRLKNFSLFLRPKLLVKGCGGTSFDTGSTLVGPSSLRLEELKPSNPEIKSGLVESSLVVSSRRPNNTERVKTPLAEPPLDSDEAFANRNGKCRGQVEGLEPSSSPYCAEKLPVGHQLVWTSSACSRGDSNDVGLSLRHRRHQQSEEIAYSNEEEDEEPASLEKLGVKKKRKALGHNESEKKRRGRINKRLKELQDLLPNSSKQVDKASMLDDAITHIKTLQLQLQMMSMGQGLYNYMPQMMMLHSGSMRHMQLSPLHPLMGMAFGPNLPPDPATGCSSVPLPTTPAMLGLRQLIAPLPTTLQCAPSVPYVGVQSPIPLLPPGSSMDQLVSTPMFIGSKNQIHQNIHPRTS